MKPAVMLDVRSMAWRLSFSIWNCWPFNWKSRSTLKTAPCCAMCFWSRMMSASTRAIIVLNCWSVISVAPLVRVVRTDAMPQRSLLMPEFTLSCG